MRRISQKAGLFGINLSTNICRHPSTLLPNGSYLRSASESSVAATHVKEFKSLPLQPVDLLTTYQALVTLGKIKSDEEQIRVVMQLRRLHRELEGYAPPALSSHYLQSGPVSSGKDEPQAWWLYEPKDTETTADLKALVRVKTHEEDLASLTTPKGLLLTGPPGSGKSFLVDLWFNSIPTPFKARKHYNQLVLEIYRGVWEETQRRMASVHRLPELHEPAPSWNRALRDKWRQLASAGLLPAKWTRNSSMAFSAATSTPQHTIAFMVAQRLILRHWLLVFDEVQLLDVSSATLLADVLSWFWRMGGVIVGTSNKVPDDLYKNGVQRERLEPFVEAMKVRCPLLSIRTERDWREVRAGDGVGRTWFTYDQEAVFLRRIRHISGVTVQPVTKILTIFGRTLQVPWTIGEICKFTFSELCEESLGPADYLTLASTFKTFIITGVPILKLSDKNQARRFISLIDALYESRCRIVCLAETEPENLFFPDASPASSSPAADPDVDVMMAEAVAETRDVYRPNVSSYDAPNMTEAPAQPQPAPALETLSIFSGKDEQFAFKRALSRLREMTSESYQRDERWAPLPDGARKWERVQRHGRGDGGGGGGGAGTSLAGAAPLAWEQTPERQRDFAEEAAYEGHGPVSSQLRPQAPRLHAEHMWGVRDDWNEHTPSRARRNEKEAGGSEKEGSSAA